MRTSASGATPNGDHVSSANFSGKLGIGLDSTNLGRMLVPIEVHGPGGVGYLNGTTLAAAAMAGRNSIGVEIDPYYCDLARTRLAAAHVGSSLVR